MDFVTPSQRTEIKRRLAVRFPNAAPRVYRLTAAKALRVVSHIRPGVTARQFADIVWGTVTAVAGPGYILQPVTHAVHVQDAWEVTIVTSGPRSMCQCGHTGDGNSSDHEPHVQPGHGACTKCECKQFTWAGWVK